MLASEQNAKGSDKIERYGWKVRDEKGNLEWLPKNNLHIDKAYQRNLSEEKRLRIASNFSWIAFGALSVALRPDGTFWIIDGSHRHAAAMSRSDIKDVPCVLFSTVGDGVDEANGFLALNTARKPLEYLDKFNALCTPETPTLCEPSR